MNWLLGVVGVAFFYSMAQIYTRICLNSKIDYRVLVAYYLLICGLFGILMMSYLYIDNKNIEINGKLLTIILTTILFAIGTIFLFYSISMKIELGIMNIVRVALQIILTMVLGYIYFNEQLTNYQLIGSILIIVGILMVYNIN